MLALYSKRFLGQYAAAPRNVRTAADKQIALLMSNLLHPSLHAKKYDESNDIWQARITRDWRIYFRIGGETYQLIQMIIRNEPRGRVPI